jgi:hypothetical protein
MSGPTSDLGGDGVAEAVVTVALRSKRQTSLRLSWLPRQSPSAAPLWKSSYPSQRLLWKGSYLPLRSSSTRKEVAWLPRKPYQSLPVVAGVGASVEPALPVPPTQSKKHVEGWVMMT